LIKIQVINSSLNYFDMKITIRHILLLLSPVLILLSCKKDEDRIIARTGQPGVLRASQSTLVLNSANANDTVQTMSWSRTNYGYPAAVRYTLEFAKGGANFASPREVNMASDTIKQFTTGELNQLALQLGLPSGSAGQIEARVKSSISDSITAVYTSPITLTVTPYLVVINYPSLYVPGDYQGWNPATAEKVSSKNDDGKYEGYVYFAPGGSFKFKFTSDPDWNHTNYGWASSTTTGNNVSGTFNTTGGDLFVPTSGYYLLTANTNTNAWTATKTSWGLIGDAVPTTGWNSDVDLTFDPSTKLWSITTTLATGNIKFRANDDWGLNFGDTAGDLVLEYDGSNIPITSAGSYTITLDLRVPWNYTYKIQKN
jgi:starch-binding outer membrane protein SusE/F